MAEYRTPALVRGNAAAAPAPAPAKGGGGSILGTIVGFLVVTLLAAGAGAGYALKVAPAAKVHADAKADAKGSGPAYSGSMVLKDLPPVVANLASPADAWVRVEASFLIDAKAVPNIDQLARELASDLVAYLRTVSLAQLQGGLALQYLREDLNERAAIRSEGKVRELIIQTLVVQQ